MDPLSRTDNRTRLKRFAASLTVEATFAFSLFFFMVYLFWQCFLLVAFELNVAKSVGEACRIMENTGYPQRKLLEEDAKDLAILYIPELIRKVESPDMVRNKLILSTASEDGSVEIYVRYDFIVSAPLFPELSLPVKQAFKVYPYIGVWDEDKLNEGEKKDEDKDEDVVYITKSGTVYHESKNCTYLKMSVSACPEDEVYKERNSSGGKYYECSACKDCMHTGFVYITDHGDRYHYSAKCKKIHRDIEEIKRSETGDRPACSKCGKKEE